MRIKQPTRKENNKEKASDNFKKVLKEEEKKVKTHKGGES